MITARLAKPVLEHEEGLNHLLIQIHPPEKFEQAVVRLIMPEGIQAGEAYGVFEADGSGEMLLHSLDRMNELLVEIYTGEAIPCGQVSLCIVVMYTDLQGNADSEQLAVQLMIAQADSAETEEPELDEEVVNKVKALAGPAGAAARNGSAGNGFLDCTPKKGITYDPYYTSELEKQYRVDGGGAF
ncbi:hypothetical protein [Paenibacillus sp. DMB5]|uniref:hypothetical protein n=1 Tax=Paenibacillus sp. DMB5 TaxID=1780103 RepID=UPI00076C5315|nr:hypothetical protein [Paenibacillus sp. DMB5]KUP26106.1 hypothetical protein AWJ19_02715 [Paenibacillus sp. DMB5]